MRVSLVAALALGLVACSGGGTVVAVDGAESDLQAHDSLRQEALPEAELPSEIRPGETAQEILVDTGGGCTAETGCFGDPCTESKECADGLCVDHLGGKVCTQFCVEECPAGFGCKQVSLGGSDLVYACVSNHPRLCRPCHEDADCQTPENEGGHCLLHAPDGSFCGSACGAGIACPEGYSCKEVATREGVSVKQCLLEEGACGCTELAVALKLSTACQQANEHGLCEGLRVCGPAGLSECDAKIPAVEQCNGLDEDCDGDVDEDTCDDSNACTTDGCDPQGGCIHQPKSGSPCNDGDSCSLGDHCEAGTCIGEPVECNDGNPCTDDLCDGQSGCKFPDRSGSCDDGDPCTFGDLCGGGKCKPGILLTCEDGNPCTEDKCDAIEGCLHSPFSGACDDGNPCTIGDKCVEGQCAPSGPAACDDDNPCTTDWCDPAKGCQFSPNKAPCDDGDVCSLGDVCAVGSCNAGSLLDCDDGNPCTKDSCNPLVGCKHTNSSDPCDDKDPCTLTDKCVGGSCVGTGAMPCDDGNPCTTDYCDPMAGCNHSVSSGGCDDGNPCTFGDVCQAGSCVPGKPAACDDANPCTDDGCDPKSGCFHKANSKPCDDLNDCTSDDHCAGGQCVSDQAVECLDGNPCTHDACLPKGGCQFVPNTAACSDGDPCTTGDVCEKGGCKPGKPVICDDNNPCTADSCGQGVCKFTPVPGNCDDGNPCTEGDVCSSGTCKGTLPADCDDMNPCTTDGCDPMAGCIHKVNTLPCDDGDACTIGDVCELATCKPGKTLVCNDANPCTKDACSGGSCQHAPQAGACDDGNACTVGDSCQQGKCMPASIDTCDDGNPCTKDSCSPAIGCQHAPQPGTCDDKNVCTVGDSCSDGNCVSGPSLNCDDGNVCTVDGCDASKGCTHAPAQGACSDGNACTLTDTCQAGVCVGANPPSCNDSNACTTDTCNPATGCVQAPITPCCGNGIMEAGETCDDGNLAPGDGCDASCKSEGLCFSDWLVGTPCNGVNYGNGCIPSDTGYHFVGIYSGYACFWHHKNQAWNTSTSSNFYNLALHFGVTPGVGRCHWCANKFSTPNPSSYGSCSSYFDAGNVGAWGWCAEGDPNSVGFVCIPAEGHVACK